MNNTPGIPSGTFTADFKNSSCPSGEDYKCHVKGDDGEGYAYLYGSYYDRNSCEELGGTDVGGSTTPSSSSKKASSSSKGGGAQGGYCIFDDYYGTDYYCQEIPPDYDSQSCIDMGGELVNKCPNVPASSSSKKASSSSAAGSTSGTACYIYYEDDGSVDWGVCIKPMNRSECNALAADVFEDDATIKYPDSCPSPKVTCPKSGGRDVYFYGYYAEQEDCDDLF
ncbi:MAG: hypothetical protein FWF63_08210 [Fibromonadales bacterium]|nr:hypothetical protein [Fibromonadales bacterium]